MTTQTLPPSKPSLPVQKPVVVRRPPKRSWSGADVLNQDASHPREDIE